MPGHSGGLTKWFKEGWVDISRPRKGGGYAPCGRKSARGKKAGGYPKCVPASKAARMTKAQIRSAVRRKRAAGNPGGKPTMVSTFKRNGRKSKKTRRTRRRNGR
jgi:hypothetical protein